MDQQTLVRADVLREKALKVRNMLVDHINTKMTDKTTLVVDKQHYHKQVNDLNDFKASGHWLSLIMRCHNLSSTGGMGPKVFLSIGDVAAARVALRRKICKVPVEKIANSDEVAVLYRCLPGRAIDKSHVGNSFIRIRDRLTVVLTVKAEGTKALPTIIGKSNRPRSFQRHLDDPKDMDLFWFAQKNAWNTKTI